MNEYNNYRPQFKSCFRCEILPSEGVMLLSEKNTFFFPPSFIDLAQLLDGQHTIEEIINLLHEKLSPWGVLSLLATIREYVIDAPPSMPLEQAAFWEMLGIAPKFAYQKLKSTSVRVIALGRINPTFFQNLLISLNVQLSDQGEYWVVLTDDYLQEELESLNKKALTENRPWVLVKSVGIEPWIGPLLLPDKTGCWECLKHRLQNRRPIESYLQQKKKTADLFLAPLAALPSTEQMVFSLAATEVVKWIVCETNTALEGKIVAINALTLEKCNHFLMRRPQCPVCGTSDLVSQRQSLPPVLRSCQKVFTADGGHRCRLPHETVQRLQQQISPITGIVSSLDRVDNGENELNSTPIYLSKGIFNDSNEDLNSIYKCLNHHSGGKGKTDIQAKVSAIGEVIERYSGGFQGDEKRIRGRMKDFNHSIHPNDCMLFSDKQLQNSHLASDHPSRSTWIPKPFDIELEIDWSPVWSLTDNEPRYLPTAYCYYGYSQLHNVQFAQADSNGCAAGNTLEEAVLQGMMELVERDSVALWWYNRLEKPAVDLSSFNEPYFQTLLEFYLKLHRDLWVIDLTSDLKIPTFAAISRRNNQELENITIGFGCHLDPEIAILRALTELNQSLPSVFSTDHQQSRAYRDRNPEALYWWTTATTENQPYLLPDRKITTKIQADYVQNWTDDLYSDVINCAKHIEDQGLETLILDQTRPDTELVVVKVIVPGLRHFWRRLAPGRLYDIPVKMGWVKEPLIEEKMNPLSMFL